MAVASDELNPFDSAVSYIGERGVIRIRGELDLAAAPILRREVGATLGRPIAALTLDLRDLSFLDSSGLHCLVHAHDDAVERQVEFELASVPHHARRIINVTGLSEMFGLEPG
jgi:anti-sigma B factor antagonist